MNASDDMKRRVFKTKFCHAFWGKMECGLVLSSVSAWEVVQKEVGETRGGYVCKWCSASGNRMVQLSHRRAGERVSLRLILDEPPPKAYNQWIKDRVEYYKRVEPTAPLRHGSGPQCSGATSLLRQHGGGQRHALVGAPEQP